MSFLVRPSGKTFRRTGMTVLSLLALAGCSSEYEAPAPAPAVHNTVGVMLPLSGSNARLGNEMLNGIKVALTGTGAPALDVKDSAAPGGASAAISQMVSAHDGIILGPLTSQDAEIISPAAQQAGVPVLAFTSDVQRARPGMWVLGITPRQQVERLVRAGKAEGRSRFAAFLPPTPFGKALGNALSEICALEGLPSPKVVYHQKDMAGLKKDFDSLLGIQPSPEVEKTADAEALPDALAQALHTSEPASGDEAAQTTPAAPTAPDLTFDALLLGDTGLALKEIIDEISAAKVGVPQVRIMGPTLWASFSGKLSALRGAWYPGTDPTARQAFVAQFRAAYHHAPTPLADIAFDGAMIAASVNRDSGGKGYPVSLLTRSAGYHGPDGVLKLMPDGVTERSLVLFEIQPVGPGRLVPGSSSVADAH
ncbi:MAG: penicillin-binding protein activator [Acetobacter sp.]|nr:penicillin-binding protein activator [Acetobacter sp.]MCI1373937.1 penicillin-binding protein activator [Acetobacter sp.]MCI1413949.1 penicillin-binding protein activator [Acetobacter sp.]MCI1442370.1 penicillin-binding protein activator [Acetobacter sp.]MCI1485613.1 penicillin-binding protein activator [Acetobacter sp.]